VVRCKAYTRARDQAVRALSAGLRTIVFVYARKKVKSLRELSFG
jgi:hypothetical protein